MKLKQKKNWKERAILSTGKRGPSEYLGDIMSIFSALLILCVLSVAVLSAGLVSRVMRGFQGNTEKKSKSSGSHPTIKKKSGSGARRMVGKKK